MRVDLLKDGFSQTVSFEKVTKFADSGLAGDEFVPEVDSDKARNFSRFVVFLNFPKVEGFAIVLWRFIDLSSPVWRGFRATARNLVTRLKSL